MEIEIPAQHRAQQQVCKIKASAWHELPIAAAKTLRRDPLLAVNFVLMVVGTACGPLLLHAYFVRGGTRKWLSSLLQTAGWLLLLLPLYASYLSRHRRCQDTAVFLMTARLLAASVVVGLMSGADNFLYAYSQAYLPVSTSSILISTQLAFTAAFALLLVRHRFTGSAVNAVVLLSVGAAMLGLDAGGDRPPGVSSVNLILVRESEWY
uniref:Uncharacterized protein n=1 Tax=Avena sativa TaxID=4498 RepID=A0ACD5Z724_AVESA